MAFLEGLMLERKERFSLLLLEPSEIYFEDFGAFYYPVEEPEPEAFQRRQRGRLKLCSKSILFDPVDVQYPILKIPFTAIHVLDKWVGRLLSKLDVKDHMLLVESTEVVEMKEGNRVAPYVFRRGKFRFLFCLTYVTVEDCLPAMSQLKRASTLDRADKNAMINAIVMSRQARVKFDPTWFDSLYEKTVMETQGDRITPLVTNPGRITLTSSRLYFQPFNNVDPVPVWKIKLSDIHRVIKRRFTLRHLGLELYCRGTSSSPTHLYLALRSEQDRNDLYDSLLSQPEVRLDDRGFENMTLCWQNGVVSNFEYIMYLNSLADRSINDLTQYPVFPWIIQDYTSDHLDLQNPATFRDLSKPIGALDSERLERLLERLVDMPEPRFLYGSHYSNPGFVLFYLARVAPEYMLCLQNGRFDHPDRIFNCVGQTWQNCMSGFSDFKELIPEFYDSSGNFLKMNSSVNFGVRHDGHVVGDVALPPWAKDEADFIRQMREGLESDYVSQNIHQWIDLIFGYKQKGEEAEKAHNVFYYLTYEGAVDLEGTEDLNQRWALEKQIMEFGQIPKQLFTSPHPQRNMPSPQAPLQAPEVPVNADHEEKTVSASDVVTGNHVIVNSNGSVECSSSKSSDGPVLSELTSVHKHKLHKDSITAVKWGPSGNLVYSVSQDCHLKVYSVEKSSQQRSIDISSMPLSSCVVMPNEKSVIASSWDNFIYVYSVEYGRMLETVHAHNDATSAMVHCVDKELLISASWDTTIKFWQCKVTSGDADLDMMTELVHEAGVNCLHSKHDQSQVVSGTLEGQVTLWDVESQIPITQMINHKSTVNSVAFSPDGRRLLTCGEDRLLHVTDLSTGTDVFTRAVEDEIKCLCWSGSQVLAGDGAGNLQRWSLINGQLLDSLPAHGGAVTCLDLFTDGRVATGGSDRIVQIWKPV